MATPGAGGALVVDSGPYQGASVRVLPGAVSQDTTVGVTLRTLPALPPEATAQRPNIYLQATLALQDLMEGDLRPTAYATELMRRSAASGVLEHGAVSVDLQPSGMTFQQPVEVVLPPPPADVAQTFFPALRVVHASTALEDGELLVPTWVNGQPRVSLGHFSNVQLFMGLSRSLALAGAIPGAGGTFHFPTATQDIQPAPVRDPAEWQAIFQSFNLVPGSAQRFATWVLCNFSRPDLDRYLPAFVTLRGLLAHLSLVPMDNVSNVDFTVHEYHTGRERALFDWMDLHPGPIHFEDAVERSLELNGGSLFGALLTLHNLTRAVAGRPPDGSSTYNPNAPFDGHWWNAQFPEHTQPGSYLAAVIRPKLAPLTALDPRITDTPGAWYHMAGLSLLALKTGGSALATLLSVADESIISPIFNRFDPGDNVANLIASSAGGILVEEAGNAAAFCPPNGFFVVPADDLGSLPVEKLERVNGVWQRSPPDMAQALSGPVDWAGRTIRGRAEVLTWDGEIQRGMASGNRSGNIYRQGVVYAVAPGQVVGAAMAYGEQGKLLRVVVEDSNGWSAYERLAGQAPPPDAAQPELGSPGWTLRAQYPIPASAGRSFYFNQSGTLAHSTLTRPVQVDGRSFRKTWRVTLSWGTAVPAFSEHPASPLIRTTGIQTAMMCPGPPGTYGAPFTDNFLETQSMVGAHGVVFDFQGDTEVSLMVTGEGEYYRAQFVDYGGQQPRWYTRALTETMPLRVQGTGGPVLSPCLGGHRCQHSGLDAQVQDDGTTTGHATQTLDLSSHRLVLFDLRAGFYAHHLRGRTETKNTAFGVTSTCTLENGFQDVFQDTLGASSSYMEPPASVACPVVNELPAITAVYCQPPSDVSLQSEFWASLSDVLDARGRVAMLPSGEVLASYRVQLQDRTGAEVSSRWVNHLTGEDPAALFQLGAGARLLLISVY